jgi:hypothetical protein
MRSSRTIHVIFAEPIPAGPGPAGCRLADTWVAR